jgi:hypothetical protein
MLQRQERNWTGIMRNTMGPIDINYCWKTIVVYSDSRICSIIYNFLTLRINLEEDSIVLTMHLSWYLQLRQRRLMQIAHLLNLFSADTVVE